MTTTYRHSAAFNDLAALLTGQLFLPQDADYEQVRQLWNGRVKTQPAAIARCWTVQDVIHTIRSLDMIAGTAPLSSRCWTRNFRMIADREWCGDRSVPDENRHH